MKETSSGLPRPADAAATAHYDRDGLRLEVEVAELRADRERREVEEIDRERLAWREHHQEWRREYYGERVDDQVPSVQDAVAIDRAVRRARKLRAAP
jgi:hypothetical protein